MSTQCDLEVLEKIAENDCLSLRIETHVGNAITEIRELRQAKQELQDSTSYYEGRLDEARWLVDEKNVDVTDHGWRNRRDTFLATFQKQESEKSLEEIVNDMWKDSHTFPAQDKMLCEGEVQQLRNLVNKGWRKTEKAKEKTQ